MYWEIQVYAWIVIGQFALWKGYKLKAISQRAPKTSSDLETLNNTPDEAVARKTTISDGALGESVT